MSEANFGHFWHIGSPEKNNESRKKNWLAHLDKKHSVLPLCPFWF